MGDKQQEEGWFIYSFVARGTVVLAEYTEFTGNFPAIAAQCLQRLPASNNRYTYACDHHTFNFLLHDGYGHYITFKRAMRSLLPEFFEDETSAFDHVSVPTEDYEIDACNENAETAGSSGIMTISADKKSIDLVNMKPQSPKKVNQIKLIRVQGIEVDFDVPFFWVVNNLKNPEYFLHICVYIVPALNPA